MNIAETLDELKRKAGKDAELKRIGGSLPLQNALREYRATGKRRLLRELLLHKRFRLLDSLYRWR